MKLSVIIIVMIIIIVMTMLIARGNVEVAALRNK